jgi:light-regulated signal transduction histidine kinase (bacteriophytochrome)
MNGSDPAFGIVTIDNCDREPIRIPGSIQPHGALLVLSRDLLDVVQAAGATLPFIGISPAELRGRSIRELFSVELIAHLEKNAAAAADPSKPTRAFRFDAFDGSGTIGVTALAQGPLLILELEQLKGEALFDPLSLVQSMVHNMQAIHGSLASCQTAAEQVRAVSGFDRVLVYRFLSDGAGEVVAESAAEGLEPYLGLRYPASDIPRQARELYLQNWLRIIPDAKYQPAPLHPDVNPFTSLPLDMSQLALRSVSPVHLEYLRNMGVRASMSLSLIVEGRLWGLIACHHASTHFLDHERRVTLELFAQMASYILETKISAEELSTRKRASELHDAMIASLSGEDDLARGLMLNQPNLLDYIHAGGVCVWMDGRIASLGRTPSKNQVKDLVAWLSENVVEGVFHSDGLPLIYPPAVEFKDVASGILALSVSRVPKDYVVWFRPELIRTVVWAGKPDKEISDTGSGMRLSPRRSFAAWEEEMRLRSEPWSSTDVSTAVALRQSLHEVVLQRIDLIAREREVARARQEILLAELDRRIQQWEATAQELKAEGDRRALVEAELSQVLRRTVVEQESERQRIARELHDSLGQYLTIMQLSLDELARNAESSQDVVSGVMRLKEVATSVGQEINRLAWEIRPTSLDDLGLQTAVEQFLEELRERSGLAVDLYLRLKGRRLPSETETTLYRILQEAVTNVVKHAGATRVSVILEAGEEDVRLIVEDNGRGFDPEEPGRDNKPSTRLGLLGIRERLALVKGRLEIESGYGRGTTLIVTVPL